MKANFNVYTDLKRNEISQNLFGHFMEHSDNVIYDGIFDLNNPLSDKNGFRDDVCEAIKQSHASTLRYPGGNFVSNYHWEDGIGPREKRPKVFDYAWLSEDDNRMGTIEFIQLCKKVGAEPYICVNMGSGTSQEAMNWVEFCNGTRDTKYANMRRELGYEEPFCVKYWGLGNEMYGDWQFNSTDAATYAKKAKDFAKAMRWVDPDIELIAAGYDLDSDWNRIVAETLKPLANHIAIHHYSIGYGIFDENNYEQCMYISDYLKKLTDVAYASIISGTNDALTKMKIAWDEWNTYAWNLENGEKEETYNLQNAIFTASILHSFIHSSDKVEIASYSPFVNKCGALHVTKDAVLKRAQFYVFKMLSEAFACANQYVGSKMDCEQIAVEEVIDFSNRLPEPKFSLDAKSLRRTVYTPYIDGVSAVNEEGTILILSFVQKNREEDCELNVKVYGKDVCWEKAECQVLYHEDIKAFNSFDDVNRVATKNEQVVTGEGTILLHKHSLTIVKVPIA